MNADIGYVTRLRTVYVAIYIVLGVHMGANMVYGPLAGTVLWDERVDRVLPWRYWWFWGQSLGAIPPTMVTLWLMSHTFLGAFYTFHMVVTGLCMAWHGVYALMIIAVYQTCGRTFCDAVTIPPAVYFPMAPDWSFNAYTAYVGLCFVCDGIYIIFNMYLHRRTEFRVAAEIQASSRAPAIGDSYLRRASNGGWSWVADMFAPPGAHSSAFNPADGSLQQLEMGRRGGGYTRMTGASVGHANDDNDDSTNSFVADKSANDASGHLTRRGHVGAVGAATTTTMISVGS